MSVLLLIIGFTVCGWVGAWFVARHHAPKPLKWFLISFLFGPVGLYYTIIKADKNSGPRDIAEPTEKQPKKAKPAKVKKKKQPKIAKAKKAGKPKKMYCPVCEKSTKHDSSTAACKKCGNLNPEYAALLRLDLDAAGIDASVAAAAPLAPPQLTPFTPPAAPASVPVTPAAAAAPAAAAEPYVAAANTPQNETNLPKQPSFGHVRVYCLVCAKKTPHDKQGVCVYCHENNLELRRAWGLEVDAAATVTTLSPLPKLAEVPVTTVDAPAVEDDFGITVDVDEDEKPSVVTAEEPMTMSTLDVDEHHPPEAIEYLPAPSTPPLTSDDVPAAPVEAAKTEPPMYVQPETSAASPAVDAVSIDIDPLPVFTATEAPAGPAAVDTTEATPEMLSFEEVVGVDTFDDEAQRDEEAEISGALEITPQDVTDTVAPTTTADHTIPSPAAPVPVPVAGQVGNVYSKIKRPRRGHVKAYCVVCNQKRPLDKEGRCKKCGQYNNDLRAAWDLEMISAAEPERLRISEDIKETTLPPIFDRAETGILLEEDASKTVPAIDQLPERPRRGTVKTYCVFCEAQHKHDRMGQCKHCGRYNNALREQWGLNAVVEVEPADTPESASVPLTPIEPALGRDTSDEQITISVAQEPEPVVEPEPEPVVEPEPEPVVEPEPEPVVEPDVGVALEEVFCEHCAAASWRDYYGDCAACGRPVEGTNHA